MMMVVVPINISGHGDKLKAPNGPDLQRMGADGDPSGSRESHWIHCQHFNGWWAIPLALVGYRVVVGVTWVKQVPGSYFQHLSKFHDHLEWFISIKWCTCLLVGPTDTTQDNPTLVLSAFVFGFHFPEKNDRQRRG
jgi:hypothetical protein